MGSLGQEIDVCFAENGREAIGIAPFQLSNPATEGKAEDGSGGSIHDSGKEAGLMKLLERAQIASVFANHLDLMGRWRKYPNGEAAVDPMRSENSERIAVPPCNDSLDGRSVRRRRGGTDHAPV